MGEIGQVNRETIQKNPSEKNENVKCSYSELIRQVFNNKSRTKLADSKWTDAKRIHEINKNIPKILFFLTGELSPFMSQTSLLN